MITFAINMMYKITPPRYINVTVNLPASKSVSNRALIIHALASDAGRRPPADALGLRQVSSALPDNLSDCDDTEVIISALRDAPDVIDIKAAGTAMRFMTAYLSVTPGTHVITGTERMRHRPIGTLVDALRRMGADIGYTGDEGFPPLRITGGELRGGEIDIPGTVSSQYISALLLIAPMMSKGLRLRLTGGVISRPYINLTMKLMHDFGAQVEWADIDMIEVRPVAYTLRPYRVENDWSAASYWYEMMAVTPSSQSTVTLPGLIDGSSQGDSAIRFLFSMLGVKTMFEPAAQGEQTTVTLTKTRTRLHRLEYDFVNQPDMAQTFVVCCALMGIPFRFTGLASLKIKETDRIEALKKEMRKMGYVVNDVNGRELIWEGERCPADGQPVIDTYDDHRMAMAFTPAAIMMPGLRINNPHVVSKSYPHFWDDLKAAGFLIDEE